MIERTTPEYKTDTAIHPDTRPELPTPTPRPELSAGNRPTPDQTPGQNEEPQNARHTDGHLIGSNNIGRDMPGVGPQDNTRPEFSPVATRQRLNQEPSFRDTIVPIDTSKPEPMSQIVTQMEEELKVTPSTLEQAKQQLQKLQQLVKRIHIREIIPQPRETRVELGKDQTLEQTLLNELFQRGKGNYSNQLIDRVLDDRMPPGDSADPDRRYRMYRALQQDAARMSPVYKADYMLDSHMRRRIDEGSLHINDINANYVEDVIQTYQEENKTTLNEEDQALLKKRLLDKVPVYQANEKDKQERAQIAERTQAETEKAYKEAIGEPSTEEIAQQEEKKRNEQNQQRRQNAIRTITTRLSNQHPLAIETEATRQYRERIASNPSLATTGEMPLEHETEAQMVQRNVEAYAEQFPGMTEEDIKTVTAEINQNIADRNQEKSTVQTRAVTPPEFIRRINSEPIVQQIAAAPNPEAPIPPDAPEATPARNPVLPPELMELSRNLARTIVVQRQNGNTEPIDALIDRHMAANPDLTAENRMAIAQDIRNRTSHMEPEQKPSTTTEQRAVASAPSPEAPTPPPEKSEEPQEQVQQTKEITAYQQVQNHIDQISQDILNRRQNVQNPNLNPQDVTMFVDRYLQDNHLMDSNGYIEVGGVHISRRELERKILNANNNPPQKKRGPWSQFKRFWTGS